jgi:hypothetical protein
MKKIIKKEKKLSLKKLQMMKINDMKTINGGDGSKGLNFNADDDDQTPTPLRHTYIK